jgi:hypothetical protein
LKHRNAESGAKAIALIALNLCEKFNVTSLEELSKKLGFKIGEIVSEPKSYRLFYLNSKVSYQ